MVLLLDQLDEGQVAVAVEADQHGVVHFAVGRAAMEVRADGGGDVEIGDGVSVFGDE